MNCNLHSREKAMEGGGRGCEIGRYGDKENEEGRMWRMVFIDTD